MRRFLISGVFLTVLMLASWSTTPSKAASSTYIQTEGAWSVYSFNEAGGKACFISATPASAKGNYTKRGEIFAILAERPFEKAQNVFSYRAGYAYDPKAPITLAIDGQNFTLYSTDATPEIAWAASQTDDDTIAAALGKGKTMVVKGRSARGSDTTDSFSLNGFGKALAASKQACTAPETPEKAPEAKN